MLKLNSLCSGSRSFLSRQRNLLGFVCVTNQCSQLLQGVGHVHLLISSDVALDDQEAIAVDFVCVLETKIWTWAGFGALIRQPYLLLKQFLEVFRDPVSIRHMKSKIHFRLHFVDILTSRSASSVVSDFQLIEWDEAVESVLLGLRLKSSLLGSWNVNKSRLTFGGVKICCLLAG